MTRAARDSRGRLRRRTAGRRRRSPAAARSRAVAAARRARARRALARRLAARHRGVGFARAVSARRLAVVRLGSGAGCRRPARSVFVAHRRIGFARPAVGLRAHRLAGRTFGAGSRDSIAGRATISIDARAGCRASPSTTGVRRHRRAQRARPRRALGAAVRDDLAVAHADAPRAQRIDRLAAGGTGASWQGQHRVFAVARRSARRCTRAM